MWSWIVVIALYLCGMGFFAALGGVTSAAGAFEHWGRSSASSRGRGSSGSR